MELFLVNLILSSMLVLLVLNLKLLIASAAIGVNYGMLGNDLPSPDQVISLYKKEKIPLLRLFEPKVEALQALRGSNITVALGVRNDDVKSLADGTNLASGWVKANVAPYAKDVEFGWITLGNEMVPGPNAEHIPKAMENVLSALHGEGLNGIKVSTVVNSVVLGASFPPSAGNFSKEASDLMKEIISWLAATDNPLLINVYPYFPYSSSPTPIPLAYALFNPDQPVIDGEHKYYSLFEAMVDAFYSAMEKNGGGNVTLVVSETGWPTAGNEPHTNRENARTYNQKLIDKMKRNGTAKKPTTILDIFIFAMFNENQKPSGVEQNWGLHYPDMRPVYPLKF